jgi:hypothetical protein
MEKPLLLLTRDARDEKNGISPSIHKPRTHVLSLLGIYSHLMFGQNSSGLAWEAVLWPFFENRCELALQAA